MVVVRLVSLQTCLKRVASTTDPCHISGNGQYAIDEKQMWHRAKKKRGLRPIAEHEKTCAVHFAELPELCGLVRNREKREVVGECFAALLNNWTGALSM